MSGAASVALALLLALLAVAAGLVPSEEDFAFEQDPQDPQESQAAPAPAVAAPAPGHPQRPRTHAATPAPVHRQWGVQDTSATVGKLLRFSIPDDAFAGGVEHYEAQGPNGTPLPPWLLFDQTSGLFEGVPTHRDVGEVYVTVRAISSHTSAKDKFSIDVLPPKVDTAPSAGVVPLGLATHHHPKVKCGPGEDATTLSIVMDVKYDHMKPYQRVATLDDISGFLSLSHDLFQLLPQTSREDILGEDSVVMAGEGNVKKRKWKQSSVVQWQVGCDGKVWPQQLSIVEELKRQARDGTLAEVLRWPVIGWRVETNPGSVAMRGRREAAVQHEAGSGNYAEDGSPDDSEGGEGSIPESRIVPTMASPVHPEPTATPIHPHPHSHNTHTEQSQHHHRHHHGDLELGGGSQDVDNTVEEFGGSRQDSGQLAPYLSSSFGVGYHSPSSPVLYASIIPTPTLDPERPTLNNAGAGTPEVSRSFEDHVEVTPSPVLPTEIEPTTYPSPGSSGGPSYVPTFGSSTTEQNLHVTDPIFDSSSSGLTTGSTTSSSTSRGVSSGDHVSESVDVHAFTERPVTFIDVTADQDYDGVNATSMGRSSTLPASTTGSPTHSPTSSTSENVEVDLKNFPPKIQARLRKLQVTAGKILRYVVPDDTFSDFEDGNTRNLGLLLKTDDGQELNLTSWILFNPARREIVMLPLEEHVSKWFFQLEAMDKEGESVADRMEINVQHHKSRRSVNHEITLVMELASLLRKTRVVEWEVVLVETLASLFGDPDTSQITVRHLDLSQLSYNGSISFTYTNDSLPRTQCPHEEIQKMLKILTLNEAGDPSQELIQALSRHAVYLNIRKIKYQGLANCEPPSGRPLPPPDSGVNYPPVPRNQVDHINATVGQLLNYKVPEDSFYDPEDGTATSMKLSLLTMDHSPISSDNWLQFDVKNQEFYGIPMADDEGSKEYQLVCEDRGGKRAYDGLIVVVHPAPRISYSVEFSMTIHPPFKTFVRNAPMKRKFVEKLQDLFRDPDTSAIVIGRIAEFTHLEPLIGEVSERAKRESKPRVNIEGSTVVNWYNRTLPTAFCPNAEILRLRRILVNEDNQISQQLSAVMGPEFTVLSVGLYPTAVCQGELTPLHPTEPPRPPVDEFTPMGSSEEYLVTFVVPAVIICTMLLLAGVVACVLYRRRRTGKMSVGDEDERQSFRNKGIPVIFQDELEERPEPANKSPVIMKEEKPPLPPPEYQRHNPSPPPTQALLSDAEDAEPYQPPPPFTTSRDTARHMRHKSTPTYRKPPPYVPP